MKKRNIYLLFIALTSPYAFAYDESVENIAPVFPQEETKAKTAAEEVASTLKDAVESKVEEAVVQGVQDSQGLAHSLTGYIWSNLWPRLQDSWSKGTITLSQMLSIVNHLSGLSGRFGDIRKAIASFGSQAKEIIALLKEGKSINAVSRILNLSAEQEANLNALYNRLENLKAQALASAESVASSMEAVK